MSTPSSSSEFPLDLLRLSLPTPPQHPGQLCEQRESHRRAADRARASKRSARLWNAETAKETAERIERTVEGWEGKEEEEELREILERTKKICGEAIEEKDSLLRMLRDDVRAQNEEYEKEHNDQRRDIEAFIKASQDTQEQTHQHQLQAWEQLQVVFKAKLDEIVAGCLQEVVDLQKDFQNEQETLLRERLARHARAIDELDQLERQSEKEYNQMQEKLEQRMHEMECDLSEAKLEYLLNSEIIEHNYVVLKKRIEETNDNLLASKRRLTKLNDTHNLLTTQLAESEKTLQDEIAGLAREVRSLVDRRQAIKKAVANRREGYRKLLEEVLANELEEERRLLVEIRGDQ